MKYKTNQERGKAKKSGRNTRRGFYTRALDEAEQFDFVLAEGVEGIDDEIALLRVKIKSLMEQDPDDLKRIMRAMEALARLVQARYSITKTDQKIALKRAIDTVMRDVGEPLGIEVKTKRRK